MTRVPTDLKFPLAAKRDQRSTFSFLPCYTYIVITYSASHIKVPYHHQAWVQGLLMGQIQSGVVQKAYRLYIHTYAHQKYLLSSQLGRSWLFFPTLPGWVGRQQLGVTSQAAVGLTMSLASSPPGNNPYCDRAPGSHQVILLWAGDT